MLSVLLAQLAEQPASLAPAGGRELVDPLLGRLLL